MESRLNGVLLLSNLGMDLGRPTFRLGTYMNRLEPMARVLAGQGVAVRLLANSYIAERIQTTCSSRSLSAPPLSVFRAPEGLEGAMIRSYRQALTPDEEHEFHSALHSALDGWEPEAVLCWETPTRLVRQAFPNACVLDLMPGALVRSPYPDLIAFDPNGLYADSWIANPERVEAPQVALKTLTDLRQYYLDHFFQLGVPEAFEEMSGHSNLERSVLLPFQISQYFGWTDTSHFASQRDLMVATHAGLSAGQKLVCTQYTGGHIQEQVINPGNVDRLRAHLPHLVYSPSFDKLDNITQYLVPFADTTVSVSSTLGLQAKFFGKRLISPASSQLKAIADGADVSSIPAAFNRAQDDIMALYLTRTCFMSHRLLNDSTYLLRILESFVSRREFTGIERFPDVEEVGNNFENLTAQSNLERSAKRFNDHRAAVTAERRAIVSVELEAITDRPIVSFDVFDTLICRTVLQPKNVFSLIRGQLRKSFPHPLPAALTRQFVELRQAAERYLTLRLREETTRREEISIDEVYGLLSADFELGPEVCQALIELEQAVELDCLIPRPMGRRLFEQAQKAGKQILVLSDTIHNGQFIEQVLRKSGYSGWDHLFVSCDEGLKKDTGSLFRHVSRVLQLNPTDVCHIGDNPNGDLRRAREHGWQSHRVVATPTKVMALVKERPLNMSVVQDSIFAGACWSGFSYHFLDSTQTESQSTGIFSQPEEIGFATLGPAMYFFTRWLVEQALSTKCRQIVLFARDTALPHRILQECFASRLRQLGISVCYIPISRQASTGLDFQSPRDVWRVRIDDFGRSHSLIELLEKRFLLLREEVDLETLKTWTPKSLDTVCAGDIPAYAIYRIAESSAELHQNQFMARARAHQDRFRRGLVQWGCDSSLKTLAVDIGYKGTLVQKVQGLFSQPMVPRFFVSYAEDVGSDPMDDCKAFYLSRQMPRFKEAETFLKYNLIIETMLNEGVGSVSGYADENEHIRVLRAPDVDKAHADVIASLHDGAMAFAHYWHEHARPLDRYLTIEPQMLLQTLSEVLRAPTKDEARLLGQLVFDNSYSGHKARRIVEERPHGKVVGGIWVEGSARLVKKESRGGPVIASANGQTDPRGSLGLQLHRVVRFVVAKSSNSRLLKKFDRDPQVFFSDSSKPLIRRIGRVLYGGSEL